MTTLHELFERQVVRSPRSPAIASVDGEMSYAQLNAAANRVAHHLRDCDIRTESLVAVFLTRSPALVTALLGVLKAGAAYVPIDPEYPADRVALILEDCAAAVVITEEALLGQLPATDAAVVCLDRDADAIGRRLESNPEPTALSSNLAYAIYTSGSTGRPKGVAVPHAGACNLADAQQAVFGPGAGDRVLQFAALGFDASVWELAMALLSGATLYVPSEARRRWRLPQLLDESRATIVTLPPSTVAALPSTSTFPSLSTLVVAGEACPPVLARAWSSGRNVYNAYGPTETSVCATCYRVESLSEDAVRVPIGGPLPGLSTYVLDADLNPVEEGELYIGGAGVARGYLFQPALTAERFLPDPYSSIPGARMYRSGDLVRRVDRGGVEFLGRLDDQVKIAGFRIEPAEVETALARCEGVREAVVLAVNREKAVRLVACVAGTSGRLPTASMLRERLARRLPAHMVPAQYIVHDELPRTPNGKIDRSALRELAGDTGAIREPGPAADRPRETGDYVVVVNEEDQHSIWPAHRDRPAGWRRIGAPAPLGGCLARIDELWTDLRPRSVR